MTTLLALLDQTLVGEEHHYDTRDTCLYALGCGLGADPTDTDQLKFVYEQSPGFSALPTYPVVLGDGGFWLSDPQYGVDWSQVLHGEQGITLHAPIPVAGTVRSSATITDIVDKGADKGAFIYTRRDIHQVPDNAAGTTAKSATGEKLLATLTSTIVARGNGGFGGPEQRRHTAPALSAMPESQPDHELDLQTSPSAALIYRLSGDLNPLHASPSAAAKAGFPKPILHGLCTLGVTGHALLKLCCGYNADAVNGLSLRFSAPVFPGETLRVSVWKTDPGQYRFQTRSVERDCVVIDYGSLTLR